MDPILEKGLGEIVWEMFTQKEPLSGIVQDLKRQGHKVSYSQVSRFIKNRVKEMSEEDKEDPTVNIVATESNKALDVITATSLKNACMRSTTKAKVLSRVPAFREQFARLWALPLADNLDNPREIEKIAGDILLQCFKWVMADIDWMKVQRHERELALKSIEAKLKFAKELKGQIGAKILIQGKEQPGVSPAGPGKGKIIQFKVKDG